MLMGLLSAAMLQAGQVGPGDLASMSIEPPKPLVMTALPRCPGQQDGGEVVVCGRDPDRHHLPLRRDPVASTDLDRSDGGMGMAAMTPAGRCGIFAGKRRCGKREAAHYGYGKGRDPITAVTRLARKIGDPDAE